MAKRITQQELSGLLAKCSLFSSLSQEEIEEITHGSDLVKYKAHDFVVRKGENPWALMVVAQGEVLEVVIDRNEFSSVAKIRYAGEFFSELSIISDLPSNTCVMAQTDCTMLQIPKSVFLKVFWSNPDMIKYVIILQSQRLLQAAERSASHTLIRTEGRLAFALLTIESESVSHGIIKVTHEFLAQYCGFARQTVSLILEDWQRKGFIAIKYRSIQIIDRMALNDVFMSEGNFKA